MLISFSTDMMKVRPSSFPSLHKDGERFNKIKHKTYIKSYGIIENRLWGYFILNYNDKNFLKPTLSEPSVLINIYYEVLWNILEEIGKILTQKMGYSFRPNVVSLKTFLCFLYYVFFSEKLNIISNAKIYFFYRLWLNMRRSSWLNRFGERKNRS